MTEGAAPMEGDDELVRRVMERLDQAAETNGGEVTIGTAEVPAVLNALIEWAEIERLKAVLMSVNMYGNGSAAPAKPKRFQTFKIGAAMSEPRERCGDCRFGESEYGIGQCFRYPPRITDESNGAFPEVGHMEWCGEFEPTLEAMGIEPRETESE